MAETVVDLGAAGFFNTDDPVEISRLTRPSYDEEGLGYFFADDGPRPFIDEEGYRVELMSEPRSRAAEGLFLEQSAERFSPYEGMAEPLGGRMTEPEGPIDVRGFKRAPELYMEDGGEVDILAGLSSDDRRRILLIGNDDISNLNDFDYEAYLQLKDNQRRGIQNFEDGGSPMFEEAGIFSAFVNRPTKEQQEIVRKSGREGSEGSAMFYDEGSPTFEQVLEQQYGYPEVPRGFDEADEDIRNQRPRFDMPTFQELEDARAHALMSAELGREFGPETSLKMGGIQEYMDEKMFFPIGGATPEDSEMDRRNNAFGVSLLKKAGIQATPQQIAQMVDKEIFNQLDRILDRKSEEKSFKSPEGGIDVYFPRDDEGYFATMKKQYR